ncbi:hypothetical protein C5B85_01665 [Pseudoclavibacter sp. AY1F1]|uniref:hypothetical protein n=1 Tax=Pseudoclavibacter sp. AY1F1 TaxID=2080583 RepID=UPI000CE808F9|nr:hypothetical protein [Pseudoclavibacter sp. AY1F1]PPF47012.1 hypothetical protein C5B85_01665 [Pseudoclavibacter sp. AY1F1]
MRYVTRHERGESSRRQDVVGAVDNKPDLRWLGWLVVVAGPPHGASESGDVLGEIVAGYRTSHKNHWRTTPAAACRPGRALARRNGRGIQERSDGIE